MSRVLPCPSSSLAAFLLSSNHCFSKLVFLLFQICLSRRSSCLILLVTPLLAPPTSAEGGTRSSPQQQQQQQQEDTLFCSPQPLVSSACDLKQNGSSRAPCRMLRLSPQRCHPPISDSPLPARLTLCSGHHCRQPAHRPGKFVSLSVRFIRNVLFCHSNERASSAFILAQELSRQKPKIFL
ncbi:unnamed protein product [Soboliphyme baturini]|uniref:Secreted protein n=1 Tax=Soboliphyme baturini TaxID=241478 RepID=A0A183IPB6_9BILA|nr:unnamed protein product [Soboliphyme baturini]